ncbi:Metallo-dependent phosphatase-like protein [Aspergillus carlsbadensis]|nr:Metallo-dependent phosphatase-like protein [Aspergillus carlsbadensis]
MEDAGAAEKKQRKRIQNRINQRAFRARRHQGKIPSSTKSNKQRQYQVSSWRLDEHQATTGLVTSADTEISYSPLPQDHKLLHLVKWNVFRGLSQNKILLSRLTTQYRLSDTTLAEPFKYYETSNFPEYSVIVPVTAPGQPVHCDSLTPTRTQMNVVHSSWINFIPFPRMRENLIKFEFEFSHSDLVRDLVGDLINLNMFVTNAALSSSSSSPRLVPTLPDKQTSLPAGESGLVQPDGHNATNGPWRGLAWGEVNFLHTTDTHGWLEGHLNEVDYGADWGDFVSFVKRMRDRADQLNVDLLVVDTGDLVTGNGLSDSTKPYGLVSRGLFENLEFDLLTVGNNDLYQKDVSRDIHENFYRIYGDRFVTSNVEIQLDNGGNVSLGSPYRHFTTKHGLRVMAFGFTLLNFKLNMSATATYVHGFNWTLHQPWFKEALDKEVDLYVLLGHAGLRDTCTFNGTYANENPLICFEEFLRQNKSGVPIQVFGGHTHQRDFKCFDSRSSGLESGRYSDTVGWLALRGVVSNNTAWNATKTLPAGVRTPNNTCTPANSIATAPPTYYIDRRYLDFNRRTFAYHAIGAQNGDVPADFDTPLGRKVSDDILKARKDLNLTTVLGCASRSYYLWVCPPGTPGNIYTLLKDALNETVKQETTNNPRVILMNNGSVRYDLYQGSFTVGDALTILPFNDDFLYIPNVEGELARSALGCLSNRTSRNTIGTVDKMQSSLIDIHNLAQSPLHARRSLLPNAPNPGHVTHDDFGNCTGKDPDSETCGDDTIHQELREQYANPTYFEYKDLDNGGQSNNFDLVFISHFEDSILKCPGINETYTKKDVQPYMTKGVTTRTFLQEYAKKKWNSPGACQIGK